MILTMMIYNIFTSVAVLYYLYEEDLKMAFSLLISQIISIGVILYGLN